MKVTAAVVRIMNYLKKHEGETVLIADISAECLIHRTTITPKIKELVAEKYISKVGKRYKVLKDLGVTCNGEEN